MPRNLAQAKRKQSESRLGFGIKTQSYIFRFDCAKRGYVAASHTCKRQPCSYGWFVIIYSWCPIMNSPNLDLCPYYWHYWLFPCEVWGGDQKQEGWRLRSSHGHVNSKLAKICDFVFGLIIVFSFRCLFRSGCFIHLLWQMLVAECPRTLIHILLKDPGGGSSPSLCASTKKLISTESS